MKCLVAILLVALVAVAMAVEKTPEAEKAPQPAETARDKRGLAYSPYYSPYAYAAPYAYSPYAYNAYNAYNLPYSYSPYAYHGYHPYYRYNYPYYNTPYY
ncbi:PREDICTED: uncharacterized protein LOC105565497 [Vollenhovia emeryi]|uniref:uncharacterized protein LOC105565497 n=1 Tax=Vollenhovia emeryi TaxID=411798 RepID=UPI0005F43F59|nr:PREDICTED: uncharacterized protein LOC105565497 [Vollenhovia emeryi]